MDQPESAQEPSELEAWKVMMDSMIKFIHASTKLMNTFNLKASNAVLPQFCGMECMPCSLQDAQKPKVCAAAASQPKSAEDGNPDESVMDTPKPGENPADNTKEDNTKETSITDTTPNEPAPDPTQDNPKEISIMDKTSNEPAPDPTQDNPKEVSIMNETSNEPALDLSQGQALPPENSVGGTQKTEDPLNVTQNANDTLNKTPMMNDSSVGTQGANHTFDESQMTNETFDETRQTNDTFDETRETNATVDDSGLQSQKTCKGKCSCSGKKKSNLALCACPVTSQETTNLTESMAAKLTKAQSEIDGLKTELEKLQFMEFTKKSNTAALYKEIMKDTNMPTPRNVNSSARSTSAPAQFTNTAPVPPACVCAPIGSPEPAFRPPPTLPMSQSQFARGIPEGRGSPEPDFRTLYNSSMAQSKFPGQTGIAAPRQGYTPTNTSARQQNFNDSNFIRTPASWQASLPTDTTQGYDVSLFPRPTAPRQGQTPTNVPTMQSHNDSNFFRPPAPTARNAPRQDNTFGPGGPTIAQISAGMPPGIQSLVQKSPRGSKNATINWLETPVGPSGPSFDNLLTSSAIGFPPVIQPQMQGPPRGYPQMRPNEVECVRYKKPKRKPTSPIPNQSPYDPRYYSQMNGGGGGNRPMENQVPFRSIQVMQAAVTVCTPPRTYADSGMYDNPAVYDNQEYEYPACDNFSCGNDSCEN